MASGRVSFQAYPQDLTTIFADLFFQSYRIGPDQVDIVLLYGNCSREQRSLFAIDSDASMFTAVSTTSCQVLRHSIPVMVVQHTAGSQYHTTLVPGFPWQLLVCLLAYPMVYYIFVQVDALWCRRDADDNEEEEDSGRDDDEDTTTMVAGPDYDYEGNVIIRDDHTQRQEDDQLPDWIQHQTAEGDFYYENTTDGTTTWMAPVGQRYLPFDDNVEETKEEIS